MKKLLVATDFSERSDRALRRAVMLAKGFGAAIMLVHVIDDDQPERLLKVEQAAASQLIEELSKSLLEFDGVDCEPKIVLGDPFAGIIAAIDQFEPDLLVIGPHRRQVLRDIFVGTTAERAIRSSRRPVLMANGVPSRPYRHVLIAVDLSDSSADAVRAVAELGLGNPVVTSVLHVFEAHLEGMLNLGGASEESKARYVESERQGAQQELENFLQGLPIRPDQELVRLLEGSAAETICGVADGIGADLVVVGTRGRGLVGNLLLGSVAGEILRRADRDVLAVPPARSG